MKKQTFECVSTIPVVEGDAVVNLNGYLARILKDDQIALTFKVEIFYHRWRGIKQVFMSPVFGIDDIREITEFPPEPPIPLEDKSFTP